MAGLVQHKITSDEVNCLIHSYLQDSGFQHSSFSLYNEARLKESPNVHKHIRRGELVELLSKALTYTEVEHHWKDGQLEQNCKAPFSLLEPHTCSDKPHEERPTYGKILATINPDITARVNSTIGTKRKAVTPDASDKRAKLDMETTSSSCKLTKSAATSSAHTPAPTPAPAPAPTPTPAIASTPAAALTPVPPPPAKPSDPHTLYLPGHTAEVFVCGFNPRYHQFLASGAKDAVVNIYTLPDPPLVPDNPITLSFGMTKHGDITTLSWSQQGNLLAVGSYDAILRVLDCRGKEYFKGTSHTGPLFAVRFSPSGNYLLTASLDHTVILWDILHKSMIHQYKFHSNCALDLDWISEDTFVSCGADAQIFIMKLNQPRPIRTLIGHLNEINQIKSNASGTRLATCSDDRTARIWNIEDLCRTPSKPDDIPGLGSNRTDVVVLSGHTHSVSTVLWAPTTLPGSNPLLATCSFDKTARLWDSVTGECYHLFAEHTRPVYAFTFSPDGKYIVTGGGDGKVIIYDIQTKQRKWVWKCASQKRGVFELEWQMPHGTNISRIAMALECHQVALIDASLIEELQSE
ncbi:WD40 repeat-like protein [Fistulina hepatica ATCC 64428]|uniref:WD40 repeat-like protein n=1 Tax=Fistulina hepatica ATCC 64428 TaxID=1128425 RepID=A0A0D7AJZ3_9AGAR|nr:WD40 repeat-like protein [Fistulina hepatica ATCC 64428]